MCETLDSKLKCDREDLRFSVQGSHSALQLERTMKGYHESRRCSRDTYRELNDWGRGAHRALAKKSTFSASFSCAIASSSLSSTTRDDNKEVKEWGGGCPPCPSEVGGKAPCLLVEVIILGILLMRHRVIVNHSG